MDVRCPNCGGPLRRFRKLTRDEEAHVRRILEVADPGAYHRCTRTGCRRFQRWSNWREGGDFPEALAAG
ncbi:hypothetical protein ACGFS9_08020 [Streptomyces sp. NPDC048566]|uniref:hypothetical protein n=1 Tax=Streptomyces sp. NPDC048566 TaxID=3365569 RepID=UPI0037246EBA